MFMRVPISLSDRMVRKFGTFGTRIPLNDHLYGIEDAECKKDLK